MFALSVQPLTYAVAESPCCNDVNDDDGKNANDER